MENNIKEILEMCWANRENDDYLTIKEFRRIQEALKQLNQPKEKYCSMVGKGFCPYEVDVGKCNIDGNCKNHIEQPKESESVEQYESESEIRKSIIEKSDKDLKDYLNQPTKKESESVLHRDRLKVLENHLGSDFYKTGQYHLNISNAMEEYANQPKESESVDCFVCESQMDLECCFMTPCEKYPNQPKAKEVSDDEILNKNKDLFDKLVDEMPFVMSNVFKPYIEELGLLMAKWMREQLTKKD